MKPTFNLVSVVTIFLLSASFVFSKPKSKPNPASAPATETVQAIPSSGGDTLDTSTPAPQGIVPPSGSKIEPNDESGENGNSVSNTNPPNENEQATVEADSSSQGFIVPLAGDVFYEPKLRLLASIGNSAPSSMLLLLDGYSENIPLSINEGVVTVEIPQLRSGAHDVAILLFNEKTEIVGRIESRFFIRLPEPERKIHNGEYKQFGRVVAKVDWKNAEAKGRIISQSELGLIPSGLTSTVADSAFKLKSGKAEVPISQELDGAMEAAYNLKYKQFQAYGKLLLRTGEDRFRQPAHRLTTSIKYGPWAGIKAGDIFPLYNSLVLNGTRIRGGEAFLNIVKGESNWGSLRVVSGESRRAVPAFVVQYDTGNGTRLDTVSSTYAQNISAARLGFGGGPSFDLGITVLKSQDRMAANDDEIISRILHGVRPSENLVPGIDLRIGFWDGRIQLYGNSALSLYTRDRSLGALSKDSFDIPVDPSSFKDIFVFNATTRGWPYLVTSNKTKSKPNVGGFLNTISTYEGGLVSSIPFSGLITETELRYSHLGLEYHSEGNPFLGGNPGDGFTLIEKLLVMDNQLSLGLELGNYIQDIGISKQLQRNMKVELRYTPGPYQPSFWIGGGRANIAPEGEYSHTYRSNFLNFNSGAYHQFQLSDGKLHTTFLYGFTQSELSFDGLASDSAPVFSATRTHIINGMFQYKMRHLDFLPRMAYTFSHNGIQLPTNSITLGFMEPFLENTVRLDFSTTVGQYPESNTKNDVSFGATSSLEYVLGPQQTFTLRERLSQYGKRRSILVGANYEMFF